MIERIGALSATGLAREASFGQVTTPTNFIPDTDMSMESDPGLFYASVMMGIRDAQVFPLYGTRKNAGDIGAPFFPTNGIPTFVAAMGSDGGDYSNSFSSTQGYGVTGIYTTGASTTLASGQPILQPTELTITSGSTTAVIAGGPALGSTTTVFTFAGSTLGLVSGSTTCTTGLTLSATPSSSGLALAAKNTVTVTSATGISIGNYIQVDANVIGTSTAEVRKVTNVAGAVVTVDFPFFFAHAAGTAVKVVSGPFTHNILQGNSLPSLTIEKNIGGYQSLQFTGSKVDKFSLKAEAGDSELSFTASVMAQKYNVLDTPSAVSVVPELPFVFAEANLSIAFPGVNGGSPIQVAQVSNVSIDLENGLKPTYTFNNSHDLQFLTPSSRKVSGQLDVVFTSLDDATWGYFNIMQNQLQGSLSLTFTHPTSSTNNPSWNTSAGDSITINLPAINIAKYADALKLEDVIMTTLNFEAAYNLGGTGQIGTSSLTTINATLVNGSWLPF